MKKNQCAFVGLLLAVGFVACSDPNTTTTTTTDADTTSNVTTNNNNTTAATGTSTGLPLNTADSTFVVKAAVGNRMEIESGTLAQQSAQSERVKAFAAMMVQDHQNASQELMRLASGRAMTVQDSLPQDKQKHMQTMRTMQGKAFDKHYMNMMVNDHKQTVADFERQASSGTDPELKAWAQKMLPALQMHRDSAVAINSALR